MGRIFFGLLFLLLGTLALLDSLDIASVEYGALWRLWPLMIVALGVSLLALPGRWKQVVVAVFAVFALGSVVAVSLGMIPVVEDDEEVRTTTLSIEEEPEAELLEVHYSGGAANITLDSLDNQAALDARLDSNVTELEHESRMENRVQLIDLRTSSFMGWHWGERRNDLDLGFTQQLPLNLFIDSGASRITGDISAVILERLNINSGASSINLRLGDNSERTDVEIDAGATSVSLEVPETSGVRVDMDQALGNLNLPGLEEVTDGVYQTSNFEDAEHTLHISGSISAGNFNISRY